ncbi:MAG: endo alpha-1,4 polygalactosaminidase [Candidatus Eisenbacteria bacterium]
MALLICGSLGFSAAAAAMEATPQNPQARDVSVAAFAYQLQNVDLAEVAANSTFDLIVIDYSADGSESGEWKVGEIASVQSSGKKVLAYISIGEAEDYRYYWDPTWATNPPSWLGPENPDWAGNYKVRFWDPGWRAIVFDYLDRIVAQGFDGIYMDIIDAYYWVRVSRTTECGRAHGRLRDRDPLASDERGPAGHARGAAERGVHPGRRRRHADAPRGVPESDRRHRHRGPLSSR